MEQDKEEVGIAHQAGKRPKKDPLFGRTIHTIETGLISRFVWHLIAALGNKDTERKRRPSNDHRLENKTEERNGLIDALGTRHWSAALQKIRSAAGSEIGPRNRFSAGVSSLISRSTRAFLVGRHRTSRWPLALISR